MDWINLIIFIFLHNSGHCRASPACRGGEGAGRHGAGRGGGAAGQGAGLRHRHNRHGAPRQLVGLGARVKEPVLPR